jgi:DNA-binding transcriptional regulator YdaS (Cro superfamily)
MASGVKAIPAEHCKTIESLTGGEVTCPEMRPLDWHKYWPELTAQAQQPAEQGVA